MSAASEPRGLVREAERTVVHRVLEPGCDHLPADYDNPLSREMLAVLDAIAPGCDGLPVPYGNTMTPEMLAAADRVMIDDARAHLNRLHAKRLTAPTNWQMAMMLLPVVFLLKRPGRGREANVEEDARAIATVALRGRISNRIGPRRIRAAVSLALTAIEAAIDFLEERARLPH